MAQLLGLEKRKFLFLCESYIPRANIIETVKRLIDFIGMTPARTPRIKDKYPYKGRGGIGYTSFHPLMESYIVVDAYKDLNHMEILLSTCKPDRAHPSAIICFMNREFGPTKFIGTL